MEWKIKKLAYLTAFLFIFLSITVNAQIKIISYTTNDVSCNGGNNGSITFTTQFGPGPFTYIVTGPGEDTVVTNLRTYTFSNLNAGSYILVARDAAGKFDVKFPLDINEPAPLDTNSSTTTVTNVKCNGGNTGAISLVMQGGTAPYTYAWSNGANTANVSGLTAGNYSVTVTDSKNCTYSVSFTITEPTPLSLSSSVTNVSCNGGSNGAIDLTESGGVGPYTFAWSNGATSEDLTGLSFGTYSVTVTDANGCTKTGSYNVTQPTALSVTGVPTNINCNGANTGAIALTVSGGTSPYTYSWSNGATSQNLSSVPAGTYSVTVTDKNGCTKNSSFTITQPPAMSITGTQVDVNCNGGTTGSININVTGGSSPYSYLWSNGATSQNLSSVAAGTYTVTVTDNNGCSKNNSFTINQPTPISITGTPVNASCTGVNNGSISISVSGGSSPFSYSWSNGSTSQNISSLAAGTYTVTVTDNKGCTKSNSYTVNQPTVMTVTNSITNVSCFGGSNGAINLTVAGGTAPITYTWSNGASTQNISGLTANTYNVTLKDNGGCTQTSSFTIAQPAAALTVTGTSTNVTCNGGNDGTINLTVTGGTSGYSYSWSNGSISQNLSGLTANSYSVKVTDSKGCTKNASYTITEPLPVSVTPTLANVSCNGGNNGSITLIVSGGNSPYTYLWNTGATTQNLTGLTANTYSATITDSKGCTKNVSYNITEPTALSVTGTQVNVSCNGGSNGSINLTVTGGITPYSYSWSNGSITQNISGLTANTYTVTVTDKNGCSNNASFTITQPTPLNVTGISNNISCFGGNDGSINLTVSGGTAPYTFSWSNGSASQNLSSLTANNYTVTVTDSKGCTQNTSFTIVEPAAISLTATPTNVTCNGGSNGSINLVVSGGTGPFTYSWSNGLTTQNLSGLTANNYTVTVTDGKGCTKSGSYTITEPAPISITGTPTDATCTGVDNGSIAISVSGGISPYSYSWSNGATSQNISGLSANSYTVTVIDQNGCSKTASYTVNQPSVMSITNTITNVSCNGGTNGTIVLTVTGGTTPYNYSWSNGNNTSSISGLQANTYTATVTDNNGCSQSNTYTITEPTAISISGTTTDVTCNGGNDGSISVNVTGGIAPYTYSWSNGLSIPSPTGLTANTYTLTVTDNNGCIKSQSFTINEPTPITITGTVTDVLCNGGNTGAVSINVSGGTGSYSYSWSNGVNVQNISSLTANSYTITVTDSKGCSQSKSFTVNEPLPITLTATPTDVTCNGGSNGAVSLTVSGGTAGYTYAWSNGPATQNIGGLTANTYTVTVTDSKACTQTGTYTVSEPPAIAITGNVIDISCNGGNNGSISLTVTNGTAPYSYAWSDGETTPTISGLALGSYSVTVTDAKGCQQTASFTIKQSTIITITNTNTDVSCNGGTDGAINISATGGTGTYTYAWSNGTNNQNLTGIAAGNYSVTVTDANSCSQTGNYTINEPLPIAITGNTTDILCNGNSTGAIDITVSGGTTPYTYSWSNTATTEDLTSIPAGSYTVTITDAHNCIQTATYTINEPLPIVISDIITDAQCNGANNGAIDITVTGGAGAYSYSWSNSAIAEDISGITAGSYTVTVTDGNNCTQSQTYTVNQPAGMTITGNAVSALCAGVGNGSIDLTVSGGTTPYTYAWSDGETVEDITNLASGAYSVNVTDGKGCSQSASFTIQVTLTFNINIFSKNPTCNGNSNGSIDSLVVTGGVLPYTYAFNGGAYSSTNSLNGLNAGTYPISVKDGNGCLQDSNFVLTEPAVLDITATFTSPICATGNVGLVNLSATGGTPTYSFSNNNSTYSASSSFGGLSPGSYKYYVKDNNGCLDSVVATLNSFPQVNISAINATIQNLTCYGVNTGQVHLSNITGGTPTYMFSLNGGTAQTDSNFIGLPAANDTIIITDAHGCNYKYPFVITSPPPIDFALNLIKYETCNNGDGAFQLSNVTGGITPYKYSFNSGAQTNYTGPVNFNNLTSATYSVTIYDNSSPGCSQTKSILLPKKPGPIPYVRLDSVHCFGGSDGQISIDSLQGGVPTFDIALNVFNKPLIPAKVNSGIGQNQTTTFTGLAAKDTFLLTITDKECTYPIYAYFLYNPNKTTYNTKYDTVPFLRVKEHLPVAAQISTTNSDRHLNIGTALVHDLSGGTPPYFFSKDNVTFYPVMNDSGLVTGLGVGNYTMYIRDNNSCPYQLDFFIGVGMFIPNLITPNNDGQNDFFEIMALPTNSEVRIFNKWGSIIYNNKDYDNSWDATNQPDGVYYYELILPDNKLFKGWVEVMR